MSSFDAMLRDLYDPARHQAAFQSPIIEMVERHLVESMVQDAAYLGSLGEHARRFELTRRRLARVEARFRAALDFSPCDCDDEW